MKKRTKNPTFIVFLVFALVGLGLLIGSVFLFLDNMRFMDAAKETTATITDIYTSRDSDGDTSHTVYVKYTVKGNEYEGKLNYYSSGMREGKSVKVFYNPDDPEDFRGGGSSIASYILAGMGLIFFMIGFISLAVQFKSKARKKRLMSTGSKIMATMTGVAPGNVTVNGRPCMHVICEYKDERDGTLYIFKSDGIWANVPHITEGQSYVPVYVDYNDYTKYYVDTEEYLESLSGANRVVDLT